MKEVYKYGLRIDECADILPAEELIYHLENLSKMWVEDCKMPIKTITNQI
jgi:hypothetical protein